MEKELTLPAETGSWLDKFGILGSSICAVHCMAVAFLPGLLILIGLDALLNEAYEWLFTIMTICIASIALWVGYKKHHSRKVLNLFLLGMFGLLISRGLESMGHHHHHEEKAHEEHGAAAVVAESSHHEKSHDGGERHEEGFLDLHLLGALIGIGSGLLVAAAHFQSIRETRCCINDMVSSTATNDRLARS